MIEQVILVDEKDNERGVAEKIEAHKKNLLHRAFSIFIFNRNGELMLQKRAPTKYHSAGLWTNTCCGHPRPGESTLEAAQRRLMEEMGIGCELTKKFDFVYQIQLSNDLSEHEFDHVFFGAYNQTPVLNATEASDWKFISLLELQKDIIDNPSQYTEWLKICLEKVTRKRLHNS